jgi:hypothetical protein
MGCGLGGDLYKKDIYRLSGCARAESNYRSQVHTIAIDMKNFLSLLQSHTLAQQTTPRTIGGCWQQAPVTLEDALGYVIPIPLELANS